MILHKNATSFSVPIDNKENKGQYLLEASVETQQQSSSWIQFDLNRDKAEYFLVTANEDVPQIITLLASRTVNMLRLKTDV